MEIERVQRWVMSALLLTTATIFAGGLSLLAGVSEQPGAEPALLSIAAVVGMAAVAGTRVIHRRSVITPLLLLGTIPAAAGALLLLAR